MLCARVEVWPRGEHVDRVEIRRIFIANTGPVEKTPYDDVGEHYVYATWFSNDEEVMVRVPDPSDENHPVTYFVHDREDGDVVCLMKACQAIEEMRKDVQE